MSGANILKVSSRLWLTRAALLIVPATRPASAGAAEPEKAPAATVSAAAPAPAPAPAPVASAKAAEPSAAQLAEAKQAFARGRAYLEVKRFKDAIEQFQTALDIKVTSGLMFHLGFAYEQAGRLREAMQAYLRTETILATSPAPDVAELLPPAKERLEASYGRLRFKGLPEQAEIQVDGQPYLAMDGLDPLAHDIVIEVPGFRPFRQSLVLARGETREVDVKLESLSTDAEASSSPVADQPEAVEAPKEGSAGRDILLWSGTGLFAVGAAIGTSFFVLGEDAARRAEEAKSTITEAAGGSDSSCAAPDSGLSRSCRDLESALEEQRSHQALMVGGFAAASVGALGALGAILLWPEASTEVAVVPRPGGFAWSISGRF